MIATPINDEFQRMITLQRLAHTVSADDESVMRDLFYAGAWSVYRVIDMAVEEARVSGDSSRLAECLEGMRRECEAVEQEAELDERWRGRA